MLWFVQNYLRDGVLVVLYCKSHSHTLWCGLSVVVVVLVVDVAEKHYLVTLGSKAISAICSKEDEAYAACVGREGKEICPNVWLLRRTAFPLKTCRSKQE